MDTTPVMPLASNAGKVGDVYRDILEWSGPLPRWQSELLRRVLRGKELTTEDVSELAEAAVAENEQQASSYAALSEADLPSVAASNEQRLLVSVSQVRNVNALRPDQTLKFGQQLTVVYGDNAAGKSGYCRVLKKVYRARVVDDILGDVRSEVPAEGKPSATFTTKTVGGADELVQWVDGTTVAGAGRFAVLDSSCSQTYLRGGTLAVGPAGIDVLDRFASEIDRVKRSLASSAAAVQPVKKTLQHLENDTEAGHFVRSLSSSTSDAAIATFAAWSPEQEAELQRVGAEVTAGNASTPSARRVELKARSEALQALRDGFASALQRVSADAVADLKRAIAADVEADAALKAAQALGDEDVSGDRLTGNAWVDMVRTAARFVQSIDSDSAAAFSLDGRCPLCWQLLDGKAQARLQRFRNHLEGAARKAKEEAARQRDELQLRLDVAAPALNAQDEAFLVQNSGLAGRLRALAANIDAHRGAIQKSMSSGDSPAMPDVDIAALDDLRVVCTRIDAERAALPATDAVATEQLAALSKQRGELAARKALAAAIEAIREFVKNTREYQRLHSAEAAINMRAASNKAKELHVKHMTDQYAKLVDDELRELRFRRQKPVLAQKTDKAKVEVKPLVSAEMKHLAAEKVFSEGERTAIALSCFLAELKLGSDPSGLIFDDPVSSLDHGVREHVARRLVTAAKERQVIVFTHDLAFLADLREQARKIQGVACEFRTLSATEHAVGLVEDDEPFGARNVGKRLRALKTVLVLAETASKRGDLQALRMQGREFYERLRSTWERFIEERLFAEVVQRLERNVIVGALPKVVYSAELAENVHEGWRRCSTAIEAHDHAPSAGQQSYSLEEMKQDLQRLMDADEAAKKAQAGARVVN